MLEDTLTVFNEYAKLMTYEPIEPDAKFLHNHVPRATSATPGSYSYTLKANLRWLLRTADQKMPAGIKRNINKITGK